MPNLCYLVVGEGDLTENLKLKSKKFLDKIIFAGAVAHNELPNYYALADAFILTPRKNNVERQRAASDTESFGIVYLEAMEFGLPVIAGNTGGAREILQRRNKALPRSSWNTDDFILVDSENIDEIAEKIKSLFNQM